MLEPDLAGGNPAHLLKYLGAGIVVHSADGRILYLNDLAARILGLGPADLPRLAERPPGWGIVAEDGSPFASEQSPVGRVLATGAPVEGVIAGLDIPGRPERLWIRINAYPERGADGAIERVVVVYVDVSDSKRAEQALQASRAKLDAALASMTDAVFISDAAGNFIDFNDAFATFHRFPDKSECRKTLSEYPDLLEVFTADGAPAPLDQWAVPRALRGETVTDAEYGLRRRDTGESWIGSYSFGPIRDASGAIVGSVVVARDITRRKAAERELRESERRFARSFHGSPAGQSLTTLPDGRILEVNDAYLKVFGYTRDELVGRTTREAGLFADAGDREQLMDAWRETGRWEPRELDVRTRTGEIRTVLASFQPIELGGVACVISSIIDITERKLAQIATLESEERFRTLVAAAPEGIFVQSDGHFRFVNPALVRMLGARREEDLLGRSILDHTAPEYHELVRERIRLQREAGAAVPPAEQELLRLDGSRVPVETVAVPVRFAGVESHLVFVRDISGRRAEERERESLREQLQQAQKMESVGRLAGGVAHDFNNILLVQKGYCELMRARLRPDDPMAEQLAQVDAAADRAAALTRQLLAFSRKQTLQPQVLDLNALVRDMDRMLRRLIGEDVELETRCAPGPAVVRADPGQLEQVVVNLVVNARDAMPTGGRIEIEVALVEGDGSRSGAPAGVGACFVELAVSDTGVGMDADTRRRVFEPFFTTKGLGKGTGLGLSTVDGIVHQSGGDILVESAPERGTTFRVRLPRLEATPAPAGRAEAGAPPGEGETVLVVEDEPAVRRLLVRQVAALGYRPHAAADGGEAVRMVEEEGLRPDLVLTDVVMPGINGRVMAERIRRTLPGVKVLYMSGYTDDIIAHQGVLDPGFDLMQKPFTQADLAQRLRRAIAAPAGG